MSTRVVVIGGGESSEHAVSLASASAVAGALGRRGYDVIELTIRPDGRWTRGMAAPARSVSESLRIALAVMESADVVYPVLHGSPGEDGAIAALCTLAHLRVAGSPAAAGAIAMDKHLTKVVAASLGISVASGTVIADLDGLEAASELLETFGSVVVKPLTAGSSHGVSLARDARGLAEAVAVARAFGRVLVEPAIRGPEVDVAVLRDADGSRFAAPPLEIHAAGLFDTAQKYDGTARFTVPAELDDATTRSLRRAALRLFDALGCAGVARMDFFVTETGIVLNEVNTTPGMTEHSQVPRMFHAAGISYDELVSRVVDGALATAVAASPAAASERRPATVG